MRFQKQLSSTFRRSLLVAIPVASVVGLTALAYAGITMFSAGDSLSAATMNANFASLQAQITALQAAAGDGGAPTAASDPAGTILAYGGPVDASHPVPSGWLVCDGSAVSRTTYSKLLVAIGVGYGTGDQVTTFNLPDLRGYFLRGLDTTAGATNDPNVASRTAENPGGNTGATVGTLQGDAFASHHHDVNDPGHAHPTQGYLINVGTNAFGNFSGGSTGYTVSSGTSAAQTNISVFNTGGTETRPKNVAVNYIIKY